MENPVVVAEEEKKPEIVASVAVEKVVEEEKAEESPKPPTERKPDPDKNGPEYVNLRGSLGRVHESELEKEELEMLSKAELYPPALTKGKFYHDFSQTQIDTLSTVRDQVWERTNRKANPPLPPKSDPDPRLEMQSTHSSHIFPQHPMQHPMPYTFGAGGIQGGNQFLMPQFAASNYLQRIQHDHESLQQRGPQKRPGINQNSATSKKVRGYTGPGYQGEDSEYTLPPGVLYVPQQQDYANASSDDLQRGYQQLEEQHGQQNQQDTQHLFDMQI